MTRQTIISRSLTAIALVALAATHLPADAQSRHGGGARPGGGGGYGYGHHHHPGYGYRPGYWGPGLFWGGVGLGVGIGLGSTPTYGWPGYYPGYVINEPPPVYYLPQPRPYPQALPLPLPLPVPAERGAPDPVIYPRTGQSPAQTEADRQDCNRWATTVPSAMADASVFNRATAACMDGRGYTLR